MENNENPPPVFPAYVVGDAVPQGHIVYQNMVVPVSIYNALQLGPTLRSRYNQNLNDTATLNCQFSQEKRMTTSKIGSKTPSINSVYTTFPKDTG